LTTTTTTTATTATKTTTKTITGTTTTIRELQDDAVTAIDVTTIVCAVVWIGVLGGLLTLR
jgi:hypothetical protein